MIPVRATPIVVRAQVQLPPDVLRNMIEEGRGKVAHDKHDELNFR
jgi:hypothetical protein